jgi:outer membrane protein
MIVSLVGMTATSAAAQSPLTLAEALHMAAERSESLAVARAGEQRADAEQQRARSGALPQVSFSGGYDRTLASQFSDFGSTTGGSTCAPLTVDASQPVENRLTEIERAAGCGAIGSLSGFSFSSLPFGQRNVYQYGLSFSQSLYTGGRVSAQQRLARSSHESAALDTIAAETQLDLDVTRAFYDAALSDRLLAIAESGLQQATATLDQTRLSFEAGRQPEFELLRAQVARENQRPIVIRRKADREIAYLRLRQLLELPNSAPLVLDVDLDAVNLPPPAPFADALAVVNRETTAADRIGVKQAETFVRLREAGVSAARAERMPSLTINSAFGQVGYPSSGSVPRLDDFRTNWTLGATVQMPLFTGLRSRANELAARADLAQARAQRKQALELAVLDAATAQQDLAAAEAVWEASGGAVQLAERAYQIAELRNREGLSTQLELSDSRLSLQVAQANRAQAARDVQVARARVALLPSLPVSVR